MDVKGLVGRSIEHAEMYVSRGMVTSSRGAVTRILVVKRDGQSVEYRPVGGLAVVALVEVENGMIVVVEG